MECIPFRNWNSAPYDTTPGGHFSTMTAWPGVVIPNVRDDQHANILYIGLCGSGHGGIPRQADAVAALLFRAIHRLISLVENHRCRRAISGVQGNT